ncbi:LacI family DNA-binding transcriptional regulator [Streptomyces sp. NPDC093970]|uniref:LacI family DNA-binding transcriptional regulator n=1 Tax=Streptomyces sp. NPDC093970 TaxID=3155076 RepID=UPI003419EF96
MQRRVTMTEVARAAGVSSATVSYVLSGKRPVSDGTRQAVEEAIVRLGFSLNPVARSLRTGRSTLVALVIPDIANPFYAHLASSLQDELRAHGCHVVVSNTGARREAEEDLLREVVNQRFAGVVMTPFRLDRDAFQELRRAGIPAVVSADVEFSDVDLVMPDSAAAVRQALALLAASGRRRVGVIAGPRDATGGDPRLQRIKDAAAAAGLSIPEELIVPGEHTRRAGVLGFRRLMAARHRPDAVMCVNDVTAVGVMDGAEHTGVDIPADIAVIGHDDIDFASLVRPRLTTISYPAHQVGRTAARLLLQQMDGRASRRVEHVVAEFVARSTT